MRRVSCAREMWTTTTAMDNGSKEMKGTRRYEGEKQGIRYLKGGEGSCCGRETGVPWGPGPPSRLLTLQLHSLPASVPLPLLPHHHSFSPIQLYTFLLLALFQHFIVALLLSFFAI